MSLVRILLFLMLMVCPSLGQTPGTFLTGQTLTAAQLNAAFATKQDAISGLSLIQLLNAAPLSPIDLVTTIPTNGFYASGSGAVFSTCPLTYAGQCLAGVMAKTYAAQYLKATAVYDSSIAEYMVLNDCNLNSGKGGAGVGTFNDNKVCQYNSVVTGANAGVSTWVQANNLVIGASDNNPIPGGQIPAKFNTELDIQNLSPDCAVAVKNCYALLLSGLVTNPITAYLSVSAGPGSSSGHPGAHFGILVNGAGQFLADTADIENSGNAVVGICNGCLAPQTHSSAGFKDKSTAPIGMSFEGTYSSAAISITQPTGNNAIDIVQTSDTSWTPFGIPVVLAATHGNQNSILGYVLNDLPASTNSLPTGVSGYAKITTNGNQGFGVYGLAELTASGGGVGVSAEFTCRNNSGNVPTTALPPNEAIGTPSTVCNALQLTSGGGNNSSIALNISNEGGSTRIFNTGIYLAPTSFAQYGLFIDRQTTGGTPNVTSAVIQNNGAGINLQLGTTSAMTPANAVIAVVDNGAVSRFKVAQNGDITSAGAITAVLPTSAGGGGLTVCVDTAGVFYKKASCP